jgi:CRISPR-associated protein Cmr2
MKTEIRKDRKAFVDTLQKHHIPQTLSRRAFAKLDRNDPLQKYDGDLFYLETYTQKHLQDDYGVELKESEVKSLQGNVKDLRKKTTKRGIDPPPKYYALLLMDGDHMGRRLRDAETQEEHRAISESLRAFSVEYVPKIVAEKYGRVVYAGGDDLMVFLPLEYVLEAVNELNQAFHQATNGLTASAGIVIAHHTAPLDGVLQAARRAEKRAKAKDGYNRNAVVFSVLKRSGEQLDVGGHWQEKETLETILELRDAIRMQKEEGQAGISPKFAFEAEMEALALSKLDQEAHQQALSRLLKRHGAGDIGEELPKRLAALGAALGDDLPADTTPTLETARWMLLARFLAAANTEED